MLKMIGIQQIRSSERIAKKSERRRTRGTISTVFMGEQTKTVIMVEWKKRKLEPLSTQPSWEATA